MIQVRIHSNFFPSFDLTYYTEAYFPPRGSDPTQCERSIIGIYDDHDFGWNNGNSREPHKLALKNMYLDAIGESPVSPRRASNRGAWTKHSFNADPEDPHSMLVDVFILDERYEREPLPCQTRRAFCEHELALGTSTSAAWCEDFLFGGPLGEGSCCNKDEKIFLGWCQLESSRQSEYFREACDPTYPNFGSRSLVLKDGEDGEGFVLARPNGSEPLDVQQSSPFCEVLGRTQRRWLRRAVRESVAPLKLFVSGSVLLHNPLPYVCGSYFDSYTNFTEQA